MIFISLKIGRSCLSNTFTIVSSGIINGIAFIIFEFIALDIEEVFAIKEDTINDIDNAEEVKDWYYFIFPSVNKFRSKYVRIYGTKISTRSTIERKCPDLDYIQYDSKEWITPAKYTNRKPCDCYTEWML